MCQSWGNPSTQDHVMNSCNPERVLLKIIYLLYFKLLISVNSHWKKFLPLRLLCVLLHSGDCLSQFISNTRNLCLAVYCAVSAHREVRSPSFISSMFLLFCLNKPLANSYYSRFQKTMKSSRKRSICSSILQSHSHLLQYEAVDMFILSLAVAVHSCKPNSP